MKVVVCGDADRQAWDAFVNEAPHASFYHRFAWRDVNEGILGHRAYYLAAMDGDRFAGILPFVHMKSRLFGSLACSMPFVNYGGPCAADPAVERLLVDEATRICDRERVRYLEIRSRHHLGPDLPSSQHKVSMTIDLAQDPEVLWKHFKSDHRQAIRRGYKHGLTARVGRGELLEPFYEVLSESWRNLGTPLYQKAFFGEIVKRFPDDVRLTVVFAGDEPAAAAFDGCHRDIVEGMWLGAKAKFRQQLAGYVLYWELLKHACETGYRRFHLGRSTAESTGETFKKKWNATATQLHWHYVLRTQREIPQLNVQNQRYQLAINAWRRLPVGLTRVIGPYIARSIP